jgi:hypothetical protein
MRRVIVADVGKDNEVHFKTVNAGWSSSALLEIDGPVQGQTTACRAADDSPVLR